MTIYLEKIFFCSISNSVQINLRCFLKSLPLYFPISNNRGNNYFKAVSF